MIAFTNLAVLLMGATAVTTPKVLCTGNDQECIAVNTVVERYFTAHRERSGQKLSEAFHASSLMFWLDHQDQLRSLSQFGWRSQLLQATPDATEQSTLLRIDLTPRSAVATADVVRKGKAYRDYLLLMKLNTGWKIVGKTFVEHSSSSAKDCEQSVRNVVNTKLASDRSWNADTLSEALHERAPVLTIDMGELVTASTAEWRSRYDERKTSNFKLDFESKIEHIECLPNGGYARWYMLTKNGERWQDFALILPVKGRWQIVTLAFTN
jgi:Putative lumazine-binding